MRRGISASTLLVQERVLTSKQFIAGILVAAAILPVGAASGRYLWKHHTPRAPEMVPLFSLLDSVGLYQKNSLVELYGAALCEQAGPLRVARSVCYMQARRADLLWNPDSVWRTLE